MVAWCKRLPRRAIRKLANNAAVAEISSSASEERVKRALER